MHNIKIMIEKFISTLIEKLTATWVYKNPGKVVQLVKDFLNRNGIESQITLFRQRASLKINNLMVVVPSEKYREAEYFLS